MFQPKMVPCSRRENRYTLIHTKLHRHTLTPSYVICELLTDYLGAIGIQTALLRRAKEDEQKSVTNILNRM